MNLPSLRLPDLDELIQLFVSSRAALGVFTAVEPGDMPAEYRRLLAHQDHMTVTVEAHHGCPVDVIVLDRKITPSHYARNSLLTRQSDGGVVQFGIMRMHMNVLDPAVRAKIESEQIPLGRILIEHDVLRRIRLQCLWRIEPAGALAKSLRLSAPRTTYGRTAMMDLNGEPAVELLEIVAPLE